MRRTVAVSSETVSTRRMASAGKSSPKSHCDFTFLAMILSVGGEVRLSRAFRRLQTLRDPLDAQRPAARLVNLHDRALQEHAFGGDAKALRRVGEEAPDDRLDFPAQHAFVRAGEASVDQVRRAAREK